MTDEVLDVLIVGAGLSGIGAACHLKRLCPGKKFALIEARNDIGGTWDLFRYPGIRSDSDMYTLGFSFRPWSGEHAIASGQSILDYLRDTAREEGVEAAIRLRQRVRRAAWSSASSQWTVEIERDDGDGYSVRCAFLLMCTGYYDYSEGFSPTFPGRDRFAGAVIHPQLWPEHFDYSGKRIVVIGSGATAVTLVPELAKTAAHVTMLQRSPSYVIARPSIDRIATWLVRVLPLGWAHGIARWKNLLFQKYFFGLCRRRPERAKQWLLDMVRKELGPDFDVDTHFTPSYNPWQQRLCLVPDGDLFTAIRERRASVVTDKIVSFTEKGIALASGVELPADVIVTATGLKMKILTGVELLVDGRALQSSELVSYKGLMFSGVPNFASVFGYFNASWTLKADLASLFVCRLLNYMERSGTRRCVPPVADASMELEPWGDFSSGYIQRAAAQLPRQGTRKPWKLNQNYLDDLLVLRFGAVSDGVLRFSV